MEKVRTTLAPLLRSKGAIAVSITLSQKPLKVLVNSDLVVGAVLSLVRSALLRLREGGSLSLSTRQVDFRHQSILDGNHCRYGACVSLTITSKGGGMDDRWMGDRLQGPILQREKGSSEDFELSAAYSIIKQHHASIRTERLARQGTTITAYFPLASLKDASQDAQSLESLCLFL
jgi:nitrogen-specific signal transduction histidine kinase